MSVGRLWKALFPTVLLQVRGTICAIYTVLDDISKALGTVVASLLGALVGSRALAFQLSMRQVLRNGVERDLSSRSTRSVPSSGLALFSLDLRRLLVVFNFSCRAGNECLIGLKPSFSCVSHS